MNKFLAALLIAFIPSIAYALEPAAPSNVTVDNLSQTSQEVCFTDNSDNEDGFNFVRQGDPVVVLPPNPSSASQICRTVTGLSANSFNNYDVTAFINAGESAPANGSGTTPPNPPAAPTNMVITNISSTEQRVCWDDNATNEDFYDINSIQLSANSVCRNFDNLTPQTDYTYNVFAGNSGGNSAILSGTLATPAPPPQTGPLAWVKPTNGNVPYPRKSKPVCTGGQNPNVDFCSADRVRWEGFPSARGFGAYASPLRNADGSFNFSVCKVTNLNESGAGSFRACYEAPGPAAIVFTVSGTIEVNSPMIARDANGSRKYIMGQTSPGGIQFVTGPGPVGCTQNCQSGPIRATRVTDMIVRYIKSRPGTSHGPSTNVQGFAYTGNWEAANNKYNTSNIIFDHVTANWSTDELFAFTGVDNSTIQWSITAEPIRCGTCRDDNNAQHDFSGAFVVTNNRVTMAYNLIMSGLKRMPNVAGNRVDVVNNIFYNPGFLMGVMYAGTYTAGNLNNTIVNAVGNFMAHGPRTTNQSSPQLTPTRKPYCWVISREGTQAPGKGAEFYGSGNICPDDIEGDNNFGDGIALKDPVNVPTNPAGGSQVIFDTPRALNLGGPDQNAMVTNAEPAMTAVAKILNHAGARQDTRTGFPRADLVEQRSTDQVRNCGNHSYSPSPVAITAIPAPGYPDLNASKTWTSDPDNDNDGMSDPWEMMEFGTTAENQNGDGDGDGWANLEEYGNLLAGENLPLVETGTLPPPNCGWPAL